VAEPDSNSKAEILRHSLLAGMLFYRLMFLSSLWLDLRMEYSRMPHHAIQSELRGLYKKAGTVKEEMDGHH